MKKKKEIIIAISAILFTLTLFIRMPQALQLVLILVAYVLVGKDTVLLAVKNIERGDFLDENFLMTVATLGAILIGEYPEAVAVMLLYEIGELFQGYAINKSRKSIAAMMDIKPEYANVIRDNKTQRVDPDEVELGEIIEIRPGERVPLDATIIKGETSLDTSALTGESVPVEVREGANILSGCININGLITAEVTKEYFDSTVNKVLDLVENAAAKKSKSERLITRFAKVYTPIVIGLAILLALLPPIISGEYNFRLWVFRALSFLVVSCPCAFVISVPLSFFSGIGAASKAGVLIKGGNYLEALAKVDTVVFDKTGTLTKGVFNVQKVVVHNKNIDENDIFLNEPMILIEYIGRLNSKKGWINGTPIYKFTYNPYLSKLGVYIDEDFIWQSLVEFLSNKRSEKEISPEVSNENKILSKGFDLKTSFRPNMKKKK